MGSSVYELETGSKNIQVPIVTGITAAPAAPRTARVFGIADGPCHHVYTELEVDSVCRVITNRSRHHWIEVAVASKTKAVKI